MIQKYEIGKKPLSHLLGWGETTVMRYLDGVEPNREFAGRIFELCSDPWQYAALLEQGREKLTEVAYRKSKRAVYRQIFCDKSTEAMQYVIGLSAGDIAPFRVVAVLYYAQVSSLVIRGIPLFEEDVCMELKQPGPYPRLYEQLMKHGIRVFSPEETALSKTDCEFLSGIYQVLNGYSPNAIRAVWKHDKRQLRRALKQEGQFARAEQLQKHYETVMQKLVMAEPIDMKFYFARCLHEM